ncbi:phytanoyl-CoA dioxygenase domain-containing protein 1-like [Saccostrea echinata]|uniref:phytanoyl-CoA dioxygenase domain-containing protein 1-like n=1 Tax=Saccostrea echinata TaxID=191078 RepID=UPI002A837ED3|nr:phytanoyl-CoA dioxygenase domain-containing protein 1-like [Saccostrea echinata]
MSVDYLSLYDRDGFIPCVDVLDKFETQRLQENFNELEREAGKKSSQYSFHNIHVKHQWVLQVATHPNLLKPIREILGPNIILLDSRFICKYPDAEMRSEGGDSAFVAWHQDMKYWGIEGRVVTAWLAVDDADVENGCMIVIPGTHKNGLVEHENCIVGGNLLSSNQSIPIQLVDVKLAQPCPVRAGQMSIHDGLLIHGSEPNTSSRRRCGFVIRYVATSARPIQDPERPRTFPSTVLVSGKNYHKNLEDNKPDWFQITY